MSKKDYKMLADIIWRVLTDGQEKHDFVDELCFELRKDNPRFNSDKFRSACGN